MTSGETIHTIKQHSDRVVSLAVSPDGKVLASGGRDDKLFLYDAKTYAVTKTMQCENAVWSLCFVDDGTLLAGVNDSEMIAVDVRTGKATELEGKYGYPSIATQARLEPAITVCMSFARN